MTRKNGVRVRDCSVNAALAPAEIKSLLRSHGDPVDDVMDWLTCPYIDVDFTSSEDLIVVAGMLTKGVSLCMSLLAPDYIEQFKTAIHELKWDSPGYIDQPRKARKQARRANP